MNRLRAFAHFAAALKLWWTYRKLTAAREFFIGYMLLTRGREPNLDELMKRMDRK